MAKKKKTAAAKSEKSSTTKGRAAATKSKSKSAARKKTVKNKTGRPAVSKAASKKAKPTAKKKAKATTPDNTEVIDVTTLIAAQPSIAKVLDDPDSLTHWFTVYLKTMVDPESNTFRAKRDDIQRFLGFFHGKHHCFDCDKWTPSITKAYIRWLPKQKAKNPRGGMTDRNLAPSTCARNIDTLRHAARWIHRQRPFVTGLPFDRRDAIEVEEPGWQGLTDADITRLKSAAEQLIAIVGLQINPHHQQRSIHLG